MRPTFMGLETAKRGIMVNQKALDIVGNNISNVKSKGYTRQRLDTAAVQFGGRGSTIGLAGQGVEAIGVGQIRDSFLDSKFREEYSDVGYYDQKAALLSEIEQAISDPEVENTGIKSALNTLLQSLTKFSENPYQETQANIVLSAFTGLSQTLNQYSQKLSEIRQNQQDDLKIAVSDINTMLEQVAELNKTIVDEIHGNSAYDGKNYGPNELLDQRNVILDELSRYGDVQITEREDGSVDVKFNGQPAVTGSANQYSVDQIQIGSDGTTLTWQSTQKEVRAFTGALRGYTEVLTGDSVVNQGIPYYQGKLDTFAQALASAFNQVIPNDDGADGFKQLLQGGLDGTITAANISASDQWITNPSYVIQKNPDGAMDNTNVMNMKNLLDQDFGFNGEFTGTFSEFVTHITTTLGSEIKMNESRLDAAVSTADSVDKSRMAVSGVSLNEEGIQMMTYNKAYQAMARMMTTMDEQLDVLINKMGMIGR